MKHGSFNVIRNTSDTCRLHTFWTTIIWSQENVNTTLHQTKCIKVHSTENVQNTGCDTREWNFFLQYTSVFHFWISVTNRELPGFLIFNFDVKLLFRLAIT